MACGMPRPPVQVMRRHPGMYVAAIAAAGLLTLPGSGWAQELSTPTAGGKAPAAPKVEAPAAPKPEAPAPPKTDAPPQPKVDAPAPPKTDTTAPPSSSSA